MRLLYLCPRFLLVVGLWVGYAPDALAGKISKIGAPAEGIVIRGHHINNDYPGTLGGETGFDDVNIWDFNVPLTSPTMPVSVPLDVTDTAGVTEYLFNVELPATPSELLSESQQKDVQFAIAIAGDRLPGGLAFDFDVTWLQPDFEGTPASTKTEHLIAWDSLTFSSDRPSMGFSIDIPDSPENTGGYTFDLIFTPTFTPEPGTAATFAVLTGALACRRRRRPAGRA